MVGQVVADPSLGLSSPCGGGTRVTILITPSGFWCLNDKLIKELMSFAKCDIGKMSSKLS
jgi:hypothetical protein